jgi:hypothetical protein
MKPGRQAGFSGAIVGFFKPCLLKPQRTPGTRVAEIVIFL